MYTRTFGKNNTKQNNRPKVNYYEKIQALRKEITERNLRLPVY